MYVSQQDPAVKRDGFNIQLLFNELINFYFDKYKYKSGNHLIVNTKKKKDKTILYTLRLAKDLRCNVFILVVGTVRFA